MKIGIFGGCFNPPHNMHKKVAQDLINQGYVDKVVFVPTGNNYNKKELIDIAYRIDMLNLVIDKDTMDVSDISKDMEYQYTFEVLDYFKAKYPGAEIYFICGTDNLNEFEMWRNYEYILRNYKLLVVGRNHDDIQQILAKYTEYKESICITEVKQNQISSTHIRTWIKEGKIDKSLCYMDAQVIKYIESKGLYKN